MAKMLGNLGNVLRLRRNELKFSQVNVANDIGVDPATYNRWENNPDDIRLGDLVRISQVLKTTLVDLLTSADSTKVEEPNEIYSLRDKVKNLEKELNLYKKLCDAKEDLLEQLRQGAMPANPKRKAS